MEMIYHKVVILNPEGGITTVRGREDDLDRGMDGQPTTTETQHRYAFLVDRQAISAISVDINPTVIHIH